MASTPYSPPSLFLAVKTLALLATGCENVIRVSPCSVKQNITGPVQYGKRVADCRLGAGDARGGPARRTGHRVGKLFERPRFAGQMMLNRSSRFDP
jgi:hypothetical protein